MTSAEHSIGTVHCGDWASSAHGASESVPIEEVMTTARTLALLAVDLCGVA